MNKPYENQMPSGVDSFVDEASKEEVKTPSNVEKEYKILSGEAVKAHLGGQKLSPEKQARYDQVKGEMSKLAKVPADKGGLKQPKQESDYEVFAKALKGSPYKADLALEEAGFARPVGYTIAHDPKSKTYSFFNESGDEIRNPERKQNQELSNLYHLRKRYLPVIEGVDESEMDINEANKIYDRWDDEKSLEEYFAKNPKSEDVSDPTVVGSNNYKPKNKTRLSSKEINERAQLLAEEDFDRTGKYPSDLSIFRKRAKEELLKENEYNDIYYGIRDILTSGKIDLNKYKIKDRFGNVALDYNNPNLTKEVMSLYPQLKDSEEVRGFIEEIYGVDGEDLFNDEEDVSDEELKEELVDNKYYYENARNEEEVAKWLAERQDIPYDRALSFVKANYKGGAIWNEEKTYEQFDKYEDDIRAKAKEISDSMKAIGYYNLGNKDQLEQAYQDLAYDLKEEFPMVDPKEIEEYVAEEGINLY